MQLPVVAPDFLLVVDSSICFCRWMTGYHSCINEMFFWKIIFNAVILGQIAIGKCYVRIRFLQLAIDFPSHDTHEGCIVVAVASFDIFGKYYPARMISFVTCTTECHKIIGCIPSNFAALNMMRFKHLIF